MASVNNNSSGGVQLPGPVVSVAWLKANYPHVKVVDASWYMPNEKQDPHANYLKARLPDARWFDLEACTSKEGVNATLPHMMPSAQQFAAYMGELGLRRDDTIVCYDGKGVFSAPRVRLTMRHFGARNVAILNGGLKAWQAAGEPLESGEPVRPTPTQFDAAEPPAGFIRTMDDVKTNSESSTPAFQLVDARSAGRFAGTDPEPRPDLPSGHIAGATNVPFTSLLDTQPANEGGATMYKSPEELHRVFAAANVDPASERTIVASCGSGVTACVVLLGLELAGRTSNTGLYDGSWTEWAINKNKIVTDKQ